MRRPHSLAVFLVLILTVGLARASIAVADWFLPAQRLTTSASAQSAPAAYGNYVVYEDKRNGNTDIYLYDLGTKAEKRLTRSTASQYAPAIYGSKVVYYDQRNGNYDIYLYDIAASRERRLTRASANQISPAIYGSKVVYQEEWNGQWEVMCLDLTTSIARRLTNNAYDDESPCIWSTKVAYTSKRGGEIDRLFIYDLSSSSERQVTHGTLSALAPVASQGKIVFLNYWGLWGDFRRSVMVHDLATGQTQEVSDLNQKARSPSISGTRIAWTQLFGSEERLCFKDLESGTRLLGITESDGTAIAGVNVIYSSSQSGNSDIYSLRPAFPTLTSTTSSVVDYGAPAQITGTFKESGGAPIVGKPLGLEYSADGKVWKSYGTTVTVTGGMYALYSPALTKARYLHVRFQADTDYRPRTTRSILVKPRVHFTSAPKVSTTAFAYGRTYRVWGYLLPRHSTLSSQVKVKAYHRDKQSDGTYKYVHKATYSTRVTNPSTTVSSKYQMNLRLPSKGRWRLRAYHKEDASNATTYSSFRYVMVQ